MKELDNGISEILQLTDKMATLIRRLEESKLSESGSIMKQLVEVTDKYDTIIFKRVMERSWLEHERKYSELTD